MPNPSLYAPWRMDYIRSLEKPDDSVCFFCAAGQADNVATRRERLVLWVSEHSVVLLNRYPYTNGHLLVSPRSHSAEMDQLAEPQLLDMQLQTIRALKLLKRALSPQGFNLGINLGRCAGAGVPGHIHQHIVPRWGGDTNFMSVVGEVRIVPQAISQLYEELIGLVAKL